MENDSKRTYFCHSTPAYINFEAYKKYRNWFQMSWEPLHTVEFFIFRGACYRVDAGRAKGNFVVRLNFQRLVCGHLPFIQLNAMSMD